MALLFLLLSTFVLALLAPILQRLVRYGTGYILALLALGQTAYLASFLPLVSDGQTPVVSFDWVPSLGVHLSLYLDGLSLLFALLITGIGSVVLVYSEGYLHGHPQLGRFYLYLLLFMGAMLGIVLAGNVFGLYVFWELTSLTSYLLIGFEHEREEARTAAWQALLVTSGAGLVMLAGFVLLTEVVGTAEFALVVERGQRLREHDAYVPLLLLLTVGAAAKSAQVPLHFWLPGAMTAPTPVSAYLHSATMVKAGVYLLARLHPALGGTEVWFNLLVPLGGVTMVVGAYLALSQVDLKRILAYATVSVLGVLVLLLGIGTEAAIEAMVVYLVAHALYKGALFLVAGILDHGTGTRDVRRLGGLARAMPSTAVVSGLAALSMAGVPPLLGYLGKERLYASSLDAPRLAAFITLLAVVASLAFVAVALVVGIRPFLAGPRAGAQAGHRASRSMSAAVAVLAVGSLLFGLFPHPLQAWVMAPAIGAVLAQDVTVELALWHGLTLPLALSVLTLGLGGGVYVWRTTLWRLHAALAERAPGGPARLYALTLHGVFRVAAVQTRLLQHGYLRGYVVVILLTGVALTAAMLVRFFEVLTPPTPDVRFYELAVAALMLVAAGIVVRSTSRLAAVTALGVVGYMMALLFVLFGAPDLAMTQFLIETLMVMLLVLVLYRMPPFARLTSPASRTRDALVALAVGAFMTVFVLLAEALPQPGVIPRYYAAHSVPEAHGHNIVNVILVDFRSLDTLGEITVLAIAGIGVFALMTLRLTSEAPR